MGSLPGADYQGAASEQAQFREFQRYQQKRAIEDASQRCQQQSEANIQSSNASSGNVGASKRKDQDDAAENGSAKKPRTGFGVD